MIVEVGYASVQNVSEPAIDCSISNCECVIRANI